MFADLVTFVALRLQPVGSRLEFESIMCGRHGITDDREWTVLDKSERSHLISVQTVTCASWPPYQSQRRAPVTYCGRLYYTRRSCCVIRRWASLSRWDCPTVPVEADCPNCSVSRLQLIGRSHSVSFVPSRFLNSLRYSSLTVFVRTEWSTWYKASSIANLPKHQTIHPCGIVNDVSLKWRRHILNFDIDTKVCYGKTGFVFTRKRWS